jgi:hypothetical protein
MKGINTHRWLAGGLAAGVVTWLIEGAASIFYMDDMQAALETRSLSMEMSGAMWMLTILVSLIVGLVLIFLYAAMRPRFGPGPRTAIIAAVALWFGGTLLSLLGYGMIGLYPAGMLATWGLIGLVELIIAGLIGGWIYREVEHHG